MNPTPTRRPGDIILDSIIPNATPEERELAYAELREFARMILTIYARVENEKTRKLENTA